VTDVNRPKVKQNKIEDLQSGLKEEIEITENLLEYFRILIEFDDKARSQKVEQPQNFEAECKN
jgi:hypothetical protein